MKKNRPKFVRLPTAQLSLDFSSSAPAIRQPDVILSGEILPPVTPVAAARGSSGQTVNPRIPEMHEKAADNALAQFKGALIAAVVIILVKAGVRVVEANVLIMKIDVTAAKSVIVGALGIVTICFAGLGSLYWIKARILRRAYPDKLMLNLDPTPYEVIFINATRVVIASIFLVIVPAAVYLAIGDILNLIYIIWFHLVPWPFDTKVEIIPLRK